MINRAGRNLDGVWVVLTPRWKREAATLCNNVSSFIRRARLMSLISLIRIATYDIFVRLAFLKLKVFRKNNLERNSTHL
jgi:hypothetical protein